MSSLLETPPTTNITALIQSAKKHLATWKKIELESLPVTEMETLGFELVDTFLQKREPELLQVALTLFEVIRGTTRMTFPGYMAYVEASLLMNKLQKASTLLEEMERFRPGVKQYKQARTNNWTKSKIFKMLTLRLQIRLAIGNDDYVMATVLFNRLSEAERDRDPNLRMLASYAHIRVAAMKNSTWVSHAQTAITLIDQFAERYGENFEVFLQRAMANEKLGNLGETYENFEKAYQSIDELDNKKSQSFQRTSLSLALWRLTKGPDVFKKVRKQTLKPEMPVLDRVQILRNLAMKRDWEGMLSVSSHLAPTDLTANEANLISFAAIEKNDYKRAEAVLNASGHDDDGNAQRLLHIARLYYVQGMLDRAIDYAELATRLCITAEMSEVMASHIFQMTVRIMHEQALRENNFDRLIKLISEFPEAWQHNELKILHVQLMLYSDTATHQQVYLKRAFKVLKSIQASERIVDWYLLSGRLKMIQEKFADALKDFKKAEKRIDKTRADVDTITLIVKNSIEDCERALHENETGEGVGALGHERLMYKTLVDHGIKIHRVVQSEPGSMPIAILERPDNKTTTAHLMTMALTYRQAKFGDAKPAEIGIAIQKSEINTLAPDDWRIRLLTAVSVSLQQNKGIRPRNGMSLHDPEGKGMLEGIVYPSIGFYDSWDEVIPKDAPIDLVEVVPMYAEEHDCAFLTGADRFMHLRLMKVPFYPVTSERQNTCEGENWKPLIPDEQIKRVYEDNGMRASVHKRILVEGIDSAIFCRVAKPGAGYLNSGWKFFTGFPEDQEKIFDDSFVMIELNTICNYLPYVIPYLDAEAGAAFVRDASGYITSTNIPEAMRLIREVNKKPRLA